MRKYRLVAKKGEGTFSEVLKAQNVKDGKYHAIKCMKNRFESIDQVNNLREIQALRRLSPHEHIISLEEVLYDQPTGRLALVFELMDANLYELIRGRKHYLNPSLIKSYMWQLMKSLDHMHKKGIFHRDIKPENILIESSTEIGRGLKLADFGSCRGIYSKQPYTEYISTRWYRAPECLLTDGYYGPEMDLWGAGCVMFEITSLYPLFPGANEVDQISRIHKVLGTPNAESLAKFRSKGASHISFDFPPQKGIGVPQLVPHASADSIDLMVKLLKYDASDRISAKEAMRHPYFKDVRETEAKLQSDAAKTATAAGGSSLNVTTGSMTNSAAPANNGASSNSSVAGNAPSHYYGGNDSNSSSSNNKPLPNISGSSAEVSAHQHQQSHKPNVGGGSSNNNNSSNSSSHLYEQQMNILKQQSQQIKSNAMPPLASTVAATLPPIMASHMGSAAHGQQAKNSARTMLPSNATQKRRKKYKMNYVQQQRAAQNSEHVMKAYGVPKQINGGGAGSSLSGGLDSGSKVLESGKAAGSSNAAPQDNRNGGGGAGAANSSAGVYGHPSRHYVAKK